MKKNKTPIVLEFISILGDGGAQTLVKDYAILLNRLKVKTEILSVYQISNSSNLKQLQDANIRVDCIFHGCNNLYKFLKKTVGCFYVPYILYKTVRKRNVSCIHVHMNQLHHVAPIVGLLGGVRILYTCHNDPSKYFRGISGKLEIRAVNHLVKYKNFKLVALHDEMAKELSNMFNTDRIEIIRNGVDFGKFSNIRKTKEEIRESLNIDKNAFVVGHIGRFAEQKNHLFLIDIFAQITKRNTNAFLLLIGSGKLEDEIRNKLNNLSLTNRYMILAHRTDIPELLMAMDVFLFPSLYEGLPVSLIEAQVSKLPCIISDTINKGAVLLPSTTVLSLNDPVEKWSEECLKEYGEIDWNDALKAYDMNSEIMRLISLYYK